MPKPISNVSGRITSLYDQGLVILTREMKHLARLSIVEKLGSGPAKDLRDYIKLLAEMKDAAIQAQAERKEKAEAAAKAKSTEELERAVAEAAPTYPIIPIKQ